MDKKDLLIQRVEQNYQEFEQRIMQLPSYQIINLAGDIVAKKEALNLSKGARLEEGQIDYFLSFENPLEVLADVWSGYHDLDMQEDFTRVMGIEVEEGLSVGQYPPSSAVRLVNAEVARIVSQYESMPEPNSPEGLWFNVPLSLEFLLNASTDDRVHLMDALPFERFYITRHLDGGISVNIHKDERTKACSILSKLKEKAPSTEQGRENPHDNREVTR